MGDHGKLEEVMSLLKGLTKEMANQTSQIATLVKIVAEQKKEIHELRVELAASIKVTRVIADHTIGMSETLKQHTTMDLIEEKLKTYAEAAKTSHIEFIQAKEEEKRLLEEEHKNQHARINNCKVSGVVEVEKEDTKQVVTSFFQSHLKVHEPTILQAYRIGQKKGDLPRPILVKFGAESEKSRVMANKSMLKGQRIWLDDDLTPTQVQARKIELEKVRVAKNQGLVAYLRNGQAFVTQRKKDASR
jgi:hypothetical protein